MAQTQLNIRTIDTIARKSEKIFIYIHRRSSRVIYSLSRTLTPTHIAEQVPFTIKKSVPALRKDEWRPLATVSFPTARQRLDAFRQLREFRKRHEYEWGDESVKQLSKSDRAKWLHDQKANSIADLAVVMQEQEQKSEEHTKLAEEEQAREVEELQIAEAREEEVLKLKAEARRVYMSSKMISGKEDYKKYKKELVKVKQNLKALRAALESGVSVADLKELQPPQPWERTIRTQWNKRSSMYMTGGFRIEWTEITDAEFAESWPTSVVHDILPIGGVRERHISASGFVDSPRKWTTTQTEEEDIPTERPPEKTTMQRVVDRLQFGRRSLQPTGA